MEHMSYTIMWHVSCASQSNWKSQHFIPVHLRFIIHLALVCFFSRTYPMSNAKHTKTHALPSKCCNSSNKNVHLDLFREKFVFSPGQSDVKIVFAGKVASKVFTLFESEQKREKKFSFAIYEAQYDEGDKVVRLICNVQQCQHLHHFASDYICPIGKQVFVNSLA